MVVHPHNGVLKEKEHKNIWMDLKGFMLIEKNPCQKHTYYLIQLDINLDKITEMKNRLGLPGKHEGRKGERCVLSRVRLYATL